MTDFSQQFFGGADTAANIAALTPSFATPATGPAYLLGIYYLDDQGALKFWYNGAFHDLSTLLANFTLTGVISPTALSASVNDYNPTGLATCAILRQDSDAAHSITGITAPSIGGQTIFFANISSFTITLTDQDAASSASNRFDLGGTDLAVTASQLIVLQYDATTARWRAVAGGGGGGGSGDVTGPASATSDAIALYNGTTGKIIKDSTKTIAGLGANPTATASDTAVNGSASTYMRSDGAPAIQKASAAQFGVVEVDDLTIQSTSGVIAAKFVGARAYNDGTQSIPNNSSTAATFNTNSYDTDSIHSTSSNTSRFTVPTGYDGYWQFSYKVTFAANATNSRIAFLRKNNTGDSNNILGAAMFCIPSSSVPTSASCTTTINLSAGDYIELFCYQNSGSSINIGEAVATDRGKVTFMEARFLGA